MNDPFRDAKAKIFYFGLFILFLVTFADYIGHKVAPVVAAWFR